MERTREVSQGSTEEKRFCVNLRIEKSLFLHLAYRYEEIGSERGNARKKILLVNGTHLQLIFTGAKIVNMKNTLRLIFLTFTIKHTRMVI